MSYRFLSIATSVLCASLFLCLLLYPELIYWLFQVQASDSSSFMLRRAAMLFLGFAVIAWLSRSATHSESRQAICLGIAVTMFTLAILGTVEYFRGAAGAGIMIAVGGEIAVSGAYFSLWQRGKNV